MHEGVSRLRVLIGWACQPVVRSADSCQSVWALGSRQGGLKAKGHCEELCRENDRTKIPRQSVGLHISEPRMPDLAYQRLWVD